MIDFKIDENGDLDLNTGDLVLSESSLQHQADIIWAGKGWWHFSPTLGVGLQDWLNESGSSPSLVRVMRQELERDGMQVDSISISAEGIKINAKYPE